MERGEVISRILEAYGVRENQLDLLGRVFDLEQNENVARVELIAERWPPIVTVSFKRKFDNRRALASYLIDHRLPYGPEIEKGMGDIPTGTYVINPEGVVIRLCLAQEPIRLI